jgi:precorrin-4/cobalt-precorrin-4 C11-methyltransferase
VAKICFVGAGPGDPELITVKGARLLGEAEVVVYAGSLVDLALVRTWAPHAEVHDSAGMTLEETTGVLVEAAAAGRRAVRLHTGDPSIYGAIQEQMAALDSRGIPYEVVPGVTSALAAAAALRQELTLPGVSQTVIIARAEGRTAVPDREQLQRLGAVGGTLCLYLSAGLIERAVSDLLAGGAFTPQTPAAVVAKASWADEQIVDGTLADIAGKVRAAGIDRQAVIIVGEVLRARRDGVPERSKLYDPGFSHGFRDNG